MDPAGRTSRFLAGLLALVTLVQGSGCGFYYLRPASSHSQGKSECPNAYRELEKGILEEYRIEPPDVIQVNAVRLIPKSPYKLKIGDTLVIEVIGTLPNAPIRGVFPIQIGGVVDLGFSYGQVAVRDMVVEDAKEAIYKHLLSHLRDPQVTVSLGNIAAAQQITGPRLVAMDGRINLGTYGTVLITGLTINDAKQHIEDHLRKFLDDPEVSVDVQNYNSKFYYVITQGGGLGDRVVKAPISGNETVLDAVAGIGGFNPTASNKIWIARPGCNRQGHDQILRVDWRAISQLGEVDTNYQILPGDRLYVSEKAFVRVNNDLRQIMAPFFTIGQFSNFMLGTIRNLTGQVLQQNNNGFNFGGGGGIGGGGVTPVPTTGF